MAVKIDQTGRDENVSCIERDIGVTSVVVYGDYTIPVNQDISFLKRM